MKNYQIKQSNLTIFQFNEEINYLLGIYDIRNHLLNSIQQLELSGLTTFKSESILNYIFKAIKVHYYMIGAKISRKAIKKLAVECEKLYWAYIEFYHRKIQNDANNKRNTI